MISRRLLVPEVVQTSAMDCGPASAKALLEGFGVSVSYGRLREACQTDVDGTSIDTMEDVLVQLGLAAEQIMVPVDHLLLPEARTLPAIVVVRQPNGLTHFLVAWRRHGNFVQLMDPATGRRWTTCRRFLEEVYVHTMPVPAAAWREWAASEDCAGALRRRLENLGIRDRAVEESLQDPGWRPVAALDATIRMVDSLVRSGGIEAGDEAGRVLETFLRRVDEAVPGGYWSVRPAPDPEQLLLRGAVLVRVRGRRAAAPAEERKPLSPELVAALEAPPSRPGRDLLRMLRADGLLAPSALAVATVLAVGGVLVEALLFRGFFDLSRMLGLTDQRVGAIGVVLLFVAALLLLEFPIAAGILRMGRRVEGRLRMAFLEKIPRLGDRYFQSRLSSDMAERSHGMHVLRQLPALGEHFLRASLELGLTVAGIIWLYPAGAPVAILAAVVAVGLPLIFQPLLTERDLRVRTHAGALSRFYLDALLGLVAVRAHGAERAVRREHESLLVEWARAGNGLQRAAVWVDGVLSAVGFGLSAWLLFTHLGRGGEAGSILLLVYWALNLPVLGQELAQTARQYPAHRNIALRLFEPLGAPEEPRASAAPAEPSGKGVAVEMKGVCVRAGGHTILEGVNLEIAPGSHVAVVGPSGAGKSSLVGILLGWHRPTAGQVRVDGAPLDGAKLERLRRETAWVDPAVQLWNRSFIDNLRYGVPPDAAVPVAAGIEKAELGGVLQKLPAGLQTPLGEGGALVSGGEGQRVRLARAMLRPGVRLAILDEPFRGLDRERRRELLARTREWWKETTLLCVTHDVQETQAFDRVVVVEGGKIAEDGSPKDLAARLDSRYRAMLDAEREVREGLWSGSGWRRLRLDEGRLNS